MKYHVYWRKIGEGNETYRGETTFPLHSIRPLIKNLNRSYPEIHHWAADDNGNPPVTCNFCDQPPVAVIKDERGTLLCENCRGAFEYGQKIFDVIVNRLPKEEKKDES